MVEMKARVRVPRTVTIGEDIEIRTMVQHPMHNGGQSDDAGNLVPKMIIHTFEASFNGEPIFTIDMAEGIAVNPYIAFNYRVTGPGDVVCRWQDDEGDIEEVTKTLNVA